MPQGQCVLGDTGTGIGGNSSRSETVPATTFAQCKSACALGACSCVAFGKTVGLAKGFDDTENTCTLFYGNIGKGVIVEVRSRLPSAGKFVTAVTVFELPILNVLVAASPLTVAKVAGAIMLVITPLVLGFLILYICFGTVVVDRYKEWKRVKHGTQKDIRDLTTEEKRERVDAETRALPGMTADQRQKIIMSKHPAMFLTYRRYAANFFQVPYKDYDFPKEGKVPYRKNHDWQTVWFLRLSHAFREPTVVRACLYPALFVGAIACLWAWAEAAFFNSPEGAETTGAVRKHMASIGKLHTTLVTPATFVVVFTLTDALKRWQKIVTYMWKIQEKIHNVAFMVGSAFARAPLKDRALLFRWYRYLNVMHMLIYCHETANFQSEAGLRLDDLVACNLLTKAEADKLRKHNWVNTDATKRQVMAWLFDLFEESKKVNLFKRGNGGMFSGALTDVILLSDSYQAEMIRETPFSWAQCTEVITHAVVGLCPFAFTELLRVEGDVVRFFLAVCSPEIARRNAGVHTHTHTHDHIRETMS